MEAVRDTIAYLLGRRAFEERHHRRYQFAASLVLRLAVSVAALAYVLDAQGEWRLVRAVFLVWVPVRLFMPELMALAHALFSGIRHQALADVQGQHYVFRGKPMRVAEWVPGERWIAVPDLERALEHPIRLGPLQKAHGEQCQQREGRWWLSAPACLDYLDGLQHAQALKLRHWVHGTVWLPSGQARRQGRDRWRR